MAVISIDLGGTKALGAVFDASGKMCARQVKLLDGAKGDAVGDIVLDLIKALCGSCRGERVEAVGICVPGIVFSKQDVVWAPNIPGWERYPLKKGSPVWSALTSRWRLRATGHATFLARSGKEPPRMRQCHLHRCRDWYRGRYSG